MKGVIKMASKEQLRKIALYCDKYNPVENNSIRSSASDYVKKYDNCINCSHYNNKGRCNLNLIDKVLSSMAMELDLKS